MSISSVPSLLRPSMAVESKDTASNVVTETGFVCTVHSAMSARFLQSHVLQHQTSDVSALVVAAPSVP